MAIPTHDKDRDASWRVFEALRTAPEPIRRSAREAIEAGNQETFLSLVTDYLQTPTSGHSQPRIAPNVLDRVDWDWLAGEVMAGPYPSATEPPPPIPRPWKLRTDGSGDAGPGASGDGR